MPKICQTVNLLDENFQLVTLTHGDEIPAWAIPRITNTAAICSCDTATETSAAPIVPTIPVDTTGLNLEGAKVDYSKLDKKGLAALCEERGLSKAGNMPDLVARLEEADTKAEEPEVVDVWTMTVAELTELATKRGVDIGDATGTEEIAALLVQAEPEK